MNASGVCRLILGLVLACLCYVTTATAHEFRPAYLQIDQMAPNRYSVIWRTPLLSGMRLPVALRFSNDVRNVTDPAKRELLDSIVERRVIEPADGSLAGKRIEFVGTQATITDVLVRVHLIDGPAVTMLVRPSLPWIDITANPGPLTVARTFMVHGIEHILFGYDHLLFVLALILIVRDWRSLLLTVTAFTAAHSITLTLATLRFVDVPGLPVEASIAFSILLLACAIIRIQRGPAEPDGAAAVAGRLCFWSAARTWLCRSAGRFGVASGRHPTGLIVLQRRRGNRATDVHNGGDQHGCIFKDDEVSSKGWTLRLSGSNLCHRCPGFILVL